MKPRLSIIIATLNAERVLARCLAAIAQQTNKSWEIVLIDGASTDATIEIIKRHASLLTYWHTAPDAGIYDAWNTGLAHARGEYVCFLGADDCFANEHAIAKLLDAVGEVKYDLVSSRGQLVDTAGKVLGYSGGAWNYQALGRRMPICHPGLLHQRELFTRFGPFDITYRITGDLDFLLRLPPDIRALHVEQTTVLVENAGVSRRQILRRLREQRTALARCPRFGVVRAYLVWLNKLWRYPIARVFRLSF